MLSNNDLEYTDDICTRRWTQDYVCDGEEELAAVLAIKNTIPNVSGVVLRLDAFRNAGAWLIYADMLRQGGRVAYVCEPLNSHRRHQKSVTFSSSSSARHLAEIIFLQKHVCDCVSVDSETLRKAQDYVKKVYAHFALDAKHLASPLDNPSVREALDALSNRSEPLFAAQT